MVSPLLHLLRGESIFFTDANTRKKTLEVKDRGQRSRYNKPTFVKRIEPTSESSRFSLQVIDNYVIVNVNFSTFI